MMSFDSVCKYFVDTAGYDVMRNKIHPRMKEIAKWSLMCASDMIEHRKNSWELYGFDFMVSCEAVYWEYPLTLISLSGG